MAKIRNSIILLCGIALLMSCETKVHSQKTYEGNIIKLKHFVIEGGDTTLHGVSAILTAKGDTLTKKVYELGQVTEYWYYDSTATTSTHKNYKQNTTVIERRSPKHGHSKKILKGDSLISWTFFDESGQAFTRQQWHKLHALNYYSEYLKYLNLLAFIPSQFNLRVLSIPQDARPGLVDIVKDDKFIIFISNISWYLSVNYLSKDRWFI